MQIRRWLLAGNHMRQRFANWRAELETVSVSRNAGVVAGNLLLWTDKGVPIVCDGVHRGPTTQEL